jgi:hypothetical protein
MKYAVLLFDDPAAWANVDESEMAGLHAEYMAVTEQPESYAGAQLQPADTAKTLRMKDGEPFVTDGPFTETKEILSGFYLIDAPTEARALEIAATIPTVSRMGGVIEVRPIVER